jgi:hypothetical protein
MGNKYTVVEVPKGSSPEVKPGTVVDIKGVDRTGKMIGTTENGTQVEVGNEGDAKFELDINQWDSSDKA